MITNDVLRGLEALHLYKPKNSLDKTVPDIGKNTEKTKVQTTSIIHRDIKPSNIMICSDGKVKVMDFGIAKISDGKRRSLTGMGTIVGTPYYSAPEQVRSRRDLIGPGTDVYAVGITLYEMLTGKPPFDAGNEFDLLRMQTDTPLPSHPGIEKGLFRILQKATEKDISKRYRSAREFRERLQKYLKNLSGDEDIAKRNPVLHNRLKVFAILSGILLPGLIILCLILNQTRLEQKRQITSLNYDVDYEKRNKRDAERSSRIASENMALQGAEIDQLKNRLNGIGTVSFVLGRTTTSNPVGYDSGYKMYFETYQPVILKSTRILGKNGEYVDIQLRNEYGGKINTKSAYASKYSWQNIILNFPIKTPGKYNLSFTSTSGEKLAWDHQTNFSAFKNDLVTILGCGQKAPGANYYEYFYDLRFSIIPPE
jgi:serine/threonine protein kinase